MYRLLCLALVTLLVSCIRAPQPPIAPALPRPQAPLPRSIPLPLAYNTYLPYIGGTVDPDASCFGNPRALAFFRLLRDDPRQQRVSIVCNVSLVRAASERANGLANGDPWAHVDRDGVTPNQYARRAGCQLPPSYPTVGNGIESLTAGMQDAQVAFDSLERSPSHSRHMFGLSDYFRTQTQVGIGLAERMGSEYTFYWVILTSKCE